jgi:hypothetical protein
LASLPRATLKSKAPLLEELAQVLDDAAVTAVDRYLRAHVAAGASRNAGQLALKPAPTSATTSPLDSTLDPFLLLLVLPHAEWPADLRRLADTA